MLQSGQTRLRCGLMICALAMVVAGGTLSARAVPLAQSPDSDPLAPALDHFYNLEYDAAEQELNAWVGKHPDDLRGLCYLANVILQREMFRREMLEAQVYAKGGEAFRGEKSAANPQLRAKLFGVLDKIQTLAAQKLDKNPRDKEALYWEGVSHVTRALYDLSIAKEKMRAIDEAKQARKAHARLLEIDPNDADALMVVGTYDYLVGSLPWYTKFLAALLGYHGSRERGIQEVERAAQRGHWARTDAKNFLAILYYREKRYGDAIRTLEDLEQSYPRNFLFPQEIARAYKARNDWRLAAREYDAILRQYESDKGRYAALPGAKVYFQAGEAYERLGEPDEALERFKKAAAFSDNNIYAYRAELAAARIELEQHHRSEARRRYQRVARAVPQTDEGRAAIQALKGFAQDP